MDLRWCRISSINSMLGLYRDNGKENGNYHLGFTVTGGESRPMIDRRPPFKGSLY